jgi:hypothetical protein
MAARTETGRADGEGKKEKQGTTTERRENKKKKKEEKRRKEKTPSHRQRVPLGFMRGSLSPIRAARNGGGRRFSLARNSKPMEKIAASPVLRFAPALRVQAAQAGLFCAAPEQNALATGRRPRG